MKKKYQLYILEGGQDNWLGPPKYYMVRGVLEMLGWSYMGGIAWSYRAGFGQIPPVLNKIEFDSEDDLDAMIKMIS